MNDSERLCNEIYEELGTEYRIQNSDPMLVYVVMHFDLKCLCDILHTQDDHLPRNGTPIPVDDLGSISTESDWFSNAANLSFQL